MAFSFLEFLKGINIVPKSGTTGSNQGDIEVDSGTTKISYHNGTTTSPVVTETHASQGTHRLTNKDLEAGSTAIVDGSDTTKKLVVDVSGATTGKTATIAAPVTNNQTLTLPDATDTLVGKATTDTLTNKTMSGGSNTFTNLPATGLTGQVPVANGGTAVSSVTTAPTASSFAGWDANKNLSANNVLDGYATTATTAGTTTLTVASAAQQYFTGTTTQTVALPVATTLVNGWTVEINNNSSGVVTVQTSGSNSIQAMAANTTLTITCINTAGGTGTASWNWLYVPAQSGILPASLGGTGQSTSSSTGVAQVSSGTWSVSTALANGTTATTQTAADNSTKVATTAYADAAASSFNNPTGAIIMYGGSTAPTGYVLCDGSAISRTTFAALFTAISTTFGVGNGTTTFNVPDMRGVFPKGAGTTARTAGKDASGNFYAGTLGTYSTDQIQGHNHAIGDPGHAHNAASGNFGEVNGSVNGVGSSGNQGNFTSSTTTASQVTSISVGSPVTDGGNGTPRTGHTTEPQSLGLTYIIKT